MKWQLIRAFYDYDGSVWNEIENASIVANANPEHIGYIVGMVDDLGFVYNSLQGVDKAVLMAYKALTEYEELKDKSIKLQRDNNDLTVKLLVHK